MASIFTVRNTKSFRLNNVEDCSWSRNIITTCYSDQDKRSRISWIFLQTRIHIYDIHYMYQVLKNMNRAENFRMVDIGIKDITF